MIYTEDDIKKDLLKTNVKEFCLNICYVLIIGILKEY